MFGSKADVVDAAISFPVVSRRGGMRTRNPASAKWTTRILWIDFWKLERERLGVCLVGDVGLEAAQGVLIAKGITCCCDPWDRCLFMNAFVALCDAFQISI